TARRSANAAGTLASSTSAGHHHGSFTVSATATSPPRACGRRSTRPAYVPAARPATVSPTSDFAPSGRVVTYVTSARPWLPETAPTTAGGGAVDRSTGIQIDAPLL